MKSMDLMDALEVVNDSKTFLAFVQSLIKNRIEAAELERADPSLAAWDVVDDWENTTIETFLEAASAWAADTGFGVSQGLSPDNPWRQFAKFLYCGKTYE